MTNPQPVRTALRPPLFVGIPVVAVFAAWFAKDAGYAPFTWYAGGLFLAALGAIVFLMYDGLALTRSALAAAGFLAAFTVWCAVSITWSTDRGIAWDGANRTALYLLVYVLFAVVPWRRSAVPIVVSLSLAAAVIGLVDLARATGDAGPFFMYGRFIAPAGYANAACAVYMFAFWPLAYVASRREPPALVRGLTLAAATALVELAVLTQSRGSLFAVPVAAVVYLVIVPGRLRAALALATVAGAALLARSRLLDVFDPVRTHAANADDAIWSALRAVGLTAAGVLVVWALVAALDSRLDLRPHTVRIANVAALVLAVVAAVVGAVALSRVDLGAKWSSFKGGYPEQTNSSRFSLGLGSNRYDFWRVAAREFRHHPVDGVGVDNFADDYVRERRSSEEPLYPHSLLLRVPAQTGVVGSLLFAGFVICAALAVVRGATFVDGVARAGVAAATYFAIHGSGDWLWEFAGLGAPAFAWLGLAASRPATRHLTLRPPLRMGAAALAVVAGVSFLFPWLAELEARRAVHGWRRDRGSAYAALADARRLNPLSTRPDVLMGAIASRVGDVPRMATSFRRVVERDDRSWYGHFELALANASLRRWGLASAELARAHALNPREPVIRSVQRSVARRRPIDRGKIDRLFVQRLRSRVGP